MYVQDFAKVYQMLEDEESREIYMGRLDYLVSGDYKYVKRFSDFYVSQAKGTIGKDIPDLIALLPKDRSIILYGAGGDASDNLCYWVGDKRFIGFCDRNEQKQSEGYFGYPVISPEELLSRRDLSVVISTHKGEVEIRKMLLEGGFPEGQIYGMTPYIAYENTGQYFAPEFMTYEDEEIFVDAGCYDLGSAFELKRYCNHLKKVYAFEPDAENYKVCLERKKKTGFADAVILPFGTWSERKTLCFNAAAEENSCVCENGECSIEVVPIDEVIDAEDRVTFIKMDVEGSELESLRGAKKTILRNKPKLAICIYHKPEDLVTIPLYIRELVPEYKLYVRHHSKGTGETVLYAVIS